MEFHGMRDNNIMTPVCVSAATLVFLFLKHFHFTSFVLVLLDERKVKHHYTAMSVLRFRPRTELYKSMFYKKLRDENQKVLD